MSFLKEAEFWVAVAFVLFMGVLAYFQVFKKVVDALDQRSARIRQELEEARRLREEAQALLAESKRKQQAAEADAAEIIAGARAEADRTAAEAKSRMDEFLARRTKMAEAKIAQAEEQAVADLRAAVGDAAVGGAEKILSENAKGKVGDGLLSKGIEDLKTGLS